MSVNRRRFLQTVGVAGAGALCQAGPAGRALASATEPQVEDPVGVLVDIANCIGCRKCEFACQEAAGFQPPAIDTFEDKSVFAEHRRPVPRSHTVINQYENGAEHPTYVKSNCLHCLHPACASACLVGAFRKDANGAVVYDAWKCMGCRYCMVACPFQIPTYDYDYPLTPQVRKCNLCADKIAQDGGVPACVGICPNDCMTYGKRSELLQLAHDKIAKSPDVYVDHVYGEHEAGGTQWLYLSKVPFEKLDFLPLGPDAPPLRTEVVQHAIFKHWIPPILWAGLLGTAMWVTRRREEGTASASSSHGRQHAKHEEPAEDVEPISTDSRWALPVGAES